MKLFNQNKNKKYTLAIFGINRFHDWVIIFGIFVCLLVLLFVYSYILYERTEGDLNGQIGDESNTASQEITVEEPSERLGEKDDARSAASQLYIDPL